VITLLFVIVGGRMRKIFRNVQDQFGDLSTRAQENFSGIRTIKAYAQEEAEIRVFREANAKPAAEVTETNVTERVRLLESELERQNAKLDQLQHNSATYLHLITETMKHTFADRAQFLGDPDFVHVPLRKLTAKEYAGWIRSRIAPDKTYPPTFYGYYNYNAEKGGTTHFSVIDKFGNAVACTQTVNTRFGSKLVASGTGIVLNNEIDDFAIHADTANVYGLIGNEANSLQPKKRPLSSLSPTIILRDGRPELVVGAAGGPRIISATLQTILNVLDFHMPVKSAVDAPRVHHQWLPDRLNVEAKIGAAEKKALQQRGHVLREQVELGVVQAITWQGSTMSGAADPRKVERARTE